MLQNRHRNPLRGIPPNGPRACSPQLLYVGKEMKHVHIAELDRDGGPVFAGQRFETPWSVFDYYALEPGKVRSIAGEGERCERGYVLLGGPAELVVGSFRKERDGSWGLRGASGEGPGFIIGPIAYDHELGNLTERVFGLFDVQVAMDRGQMVAVERDTFVHAGSFSQAELKWRDAIHGGCGKIATRHVLKPEDFCSTWTFLDHAILSEGGSVGYHYHDALEESFVVLSGEGLMTIDDETFAVGQGSVTWQGIGQGHGIYNPGPKELEFVRIAVAQRDEEYTTIDLHDDLSSREPT